MAGALSCTLDRVGLNGSSQPPDTTDGARDTRPSDPSSDGFSDGPSDRPYDLTGGDDLADGLPTGEGGGPDTDASAGGTGGAGGGTAGGTGAGGALADGSRDTGGPADAPVDLGTPDLQGSPDLAVDAVVCGASPRCGTGAVSVTPPGGRFTGTTAGASLAGGSCGGDNAPEAAFRLVLTQRSDVFITTHGTGFDTVVYMRNDCCGAEIGCNDDADLRDTSVLTARGLAAGAYVIFVDGAAANARGAFTIDIYATPTTDSTTDNCGSAARIANLAVNGTTCGLGDDFGPLGTGCLAPPATAASGGDAVYYFVLDDATTTVAFSTCASTCIDTVLFVRDVCTLAASQRACNDNFCRPTTCPIGPPTQSRTTATLGPGVHYLVLDSHAVTPTSPCGPFSITATGVPP